MKVFEKLKKIGKRCKVVVATAAAAVVGVVSSVCASAATAEASNGVDMAKTLSDAGNQMTAQFGTLVATLVPVIIGILTAGLAIFGIMQLIKLAKKTFGKVAG